VELRVLLDVLGLEVVGPEHPQVVLHQVGTLFFDLNGALAEHVVVGALVLLLTALHGLRFDAGLGRVVDATGQVAVGVDPSRWADPVDERGDAGENGHAEMLLCLDC